MDQRIIKLYDSFTHGGMSRREFLDRLTRLSGSAAAAAAVLPLLQNNYAQAAIVAENDPRLATERVAYDSPKGKINGYLVRPTSKGKRPAIIFIQENRGLNPHIEDVARRLAVEGFLVFAPDLLSTGGWGRRADVGQRCAAAPYRCQVPRRASAQGTIEQCRKDGLRVTTTVMNRAGQVMVVLRDDGTSPHTVDTSRRKAYTAVALRRTSSDLGSAIAGNAALAGLKDISGVIVLGGGVPIRVGNEVIGSIGVAGSPSPDKDEACAKAALDQVADQLK